MDNKKLIAFRCPDDVLAQMDKICDANMIDRTAFISFALRNLLLSAGEEGVVEPLNIEDRAEKPKRVYTGRPRGRKPKNKLEAPSSETL